jgi:hypothetical protein
VSAPTPPSAEAVAREDVDLIIRACYDPLSRRLMRDDAVALATAALTAHATAAVAEAEARVWNEAADAMEGYDMEWSHDFRERAAAIGRAPETP